MWVYDDGGRAEAGFRGDAGDCVCRAVAIVTDKPYREVYNELASRQSAAGRPRSARNGVPMPIVREYLASLGFRWRPAMTIGSGCQVHLRADELPGGRIVARVSKHLCAVVDGIVHDTHDSTRGGTRCVYGWFEQVDG